MQRDKYNSVEQFLSDSSFREWVRTGSDHTYWIQWLDANPGKNQIALEARHILLAIGLADSEQNPEATGKALDQSWSKIRNLQKNARSKTRSLWWQAAAAVVLIALGAAWYARHPKASIDAVPVLALAAKHKIEHRNNSEKPQLINLVDGSSVILQPGGKLTYPEVFDSTSREVYLSGEAFFEISKNPERPFIVYTRDVITRVVGTSFLIKALENQPNVDVFVKTGKVNIKKVHPANSRLIQDSISLLPNESISFVKDQNSFLKKNMLQLPKTAFEQYSFEFNDAPVETIFMAIEGAYGLKVQYPKDLLKDCFLSTSLSDQPLREKLKIICESLGLNSTYQLEEDRIIITSTGCN